MKTSDLNNHAHSLSHLLSEHFRDYSGHFFSPDTLRFFRSRIPDTGYLRSDNSILFITSEKKCFNDLTRVYNVRLMFRHPDNSIGIKTLNTFSTKAQALSFIRSIFTEVMP